MKKKITLFKDKKTWKYIIIISVFFSIAELTWYDSISHIGSGKTSLLNLPLEAVLVIILVWFILGERLRQFQIVGASIAIVGFTLSASIKQNRAHI
jgi:drug/metabolite transporter (DMT)-like permease